MTPNKIETSLKINNTKEFGLCVEIYSLGIVPSLVKSILSYCSNICSCIVLGKCLRTQQSLIYENTTNLDIRHGTISNCQLDKILTCIKKLSINAYPC